MSEYLSEAFRALEMLNEEQFDITTGDFEDAKNFLADDEIEDTVEIIDTEAENEGDIKDSYLGNVVLDCNVCHSKCYKAEEEIEIDEESETVNVEEECPFCGGTEGFTIIGKIVPFEEVVVDVESKDDVDEVDLDSNDDTDKDTDNIETDKNDVKESLSKNEATENRGKTIDRSKLVRRNHKLTEAPYLEPEYDSRKSFYDKARISKDGNTLYSYDTKVMDIVDGTPKITCELEELSATTLRHIKEFLKQNGFKAETKQQIIRDYMNESFDKINIETDNEIINVSSESKPEDSEEEMIAPLTDFDMDNITSDEEEETMKDEFTDEEDVDLEDEEVEEVEESLEESEEIDVDIDEIDETDIDKLEESYLKKIYSNVSSYKTTGCATKDNKLIFEGLITFKSGKKKPTRFVFEAKEITKRGKVKFIGENTQITSNKHPFMLLGKVKNGKLLAESFTYNYREQNPKTKKSQRVYGRVVSNKRG